MKFEIPAGEALDTLKRAAHQAGHEIMYPADAVRGVRTHAVRGEFTPFEALSLMVANTVLKVVRDEVSGALAVMRHSSAHKDSNSRRSSSSRATIETSGGAMKRTNPIAEYYFRKAGLISAGVTGQF